MMQDEVIVTTFEELSWYVLGGSEESYEKLHQET
jgi:hypothetical protein